MTTLFDRTPGSIIYPCINYTERTENITIKKNKSTIIIDPICIELFSQGCEGDKMLALKMNEPNFSTIRKNSRNGIFTFAKTAVTSNGVIITTHDYYLNGDCFKCSNNKWSKKSALQFRKHLESKSKRYNKVITIAQLWGEGAWHFPIECLTALKNFYTFKDVYLHINKKSKFCMNWIKFLNVPIKEENIIEGDIFANVLIVPEISGCGSPKYNQIIWLKNMILNRINFNNEHNLLILIKRNYKRQVSNHDEVVKLCNNYCNENKLKLYIHDDSKLPDLKTQFNFFNKAKLVIGPHGAGGVNLLSCKPKTTFIEFLLTEHINSCYIKLVSQVDINYYGIPYNRSGVDISILKKYLSQVKI